MKRPTSSQFRAARGMLNLSREKVADLVGLHHRTVGKAERGDPTLGWRAAETIVAFYAARGVVFIGNTGVERKPQ